ncbi:hypothetical protein LguiB_026257 [Lonicera macranthoides]
MALRFIQPGSSRVKASVLTILNLWGPHNPNLWNPLSSSSSSIPISSYLHSNAIASSIPNPARNGIKTLGTSIYKDAQKDEWIITLAQFAVNQHNHRQDAHLEFVRVVGASHTGMSNLLYHITLEAKHARKQKIYHAVVWLQLWKNLMELLVWNTVNDALSAIGVKGGYMKIQFLFSGLSHMDGKNAQHGRFSNPVDRNEVGFFGTEAGDLKLHETVMFMNQMKKDLPRI